MTNCPDPLPYERDAAQTPETSEVAVPAVVDDSEAQRRQIYRELDDALRRITMGVGEHS
jgi:hypothetical protein